MPVDHPTMHYERKLYTTPDGHLLTMLTEKEPIEEGIGHYVDTVCRGVDTNGLACVVLTCHRGTASRAKLAQWIFEMRFLKEYPQFRSHMCAPSHVCFSDEDIQASAICVPGGRDVLETVLRSMSNREHTESRRRFAAQLVIFATRMLVELAKVDQVELLSDLKPENILFFGGDPATASASDFRMIDFGFYDTMRTVVADDGEIVKLVPFTEAYLHPKRKMNEYACARDALYAIAKMYFGISALRVMEGDDLDTYVELFGTSLDRVMLDIYERAEYADTNDDVRDDCDRIAHIAVYMP